jgi:hypothetical protein
MIDLDFTAVPKAAWTISDHEKLRDPTSKLDRRPEALNYP